MNTAAKRLEGASNKQAWRAARVESGGLEQVKERIRDQRTGVFLDTLAQDLGNGARNAHRSG